LDAFNGSKEKQLEVGLLIACLPLSFLIYPDAPNLSGFPQIPTLVTLLLFHWYLLPLYLNALRSVFSLTGIDMAGVFNSLLATQNRMRDTALGLELTVTI
jgi:hypothetical protein